MAETPSTEVVIANLRERIRDLDHDQIQAIETATYIPMNRQEAQDYEERGERLNALRRELIALIRKQQ